MITSIIDQKKLFFCQGTSLYISPSLQKKFSTNTKYDFQLIGQKSTYPKTQIWILYKVLTNIVPTFLAKKTRGPGALSRAQEYHCNLVLFFF